MTPPPGLTGPVGTPHRAPKAWNALMHVQFVAVPNAIRRSQAARKRMRQLRRRVRR